MEEFALRKRARPLQKLRCVFKMGGMDTRKAEVEAAVRMTTKLKALMDAVDDPLEQ